MLINNEIYSKTDLKSDYLFKFIRYEGLRLVRSYDTVFPKRHFKDFLDYIEMNEHDFFNIVETFRSLHLWRKKG